MASFQMDDIMAQALAITRAQASVRAMSAEEVVTYAQEVAKGLQRAMEHDEGSTPQDKETSTVLEQDPKKSIRESSVVCLECGQKFKMLTKRHLKLHGLTPLEYKEKYGLKKSASLACKSIQRMRRQKMQDMRLWERRLGTSEEVEE